MLLYACKSQHVRRLQVDGWQTLCQQRIGAMHANLAAKRDDDLPCLCMTCRNLMTTFEDGRNSTCRLPRFSALYMFLSASFNTRVKCLHPVRPFAPLQHPEGR